MSVVVLDASAALAWCFDEERTPQTEALLRRVEAGGALVPSHWPVEVANALLVAERRQRLKAPAVDGLLELIASLPISLDGRAATNLSGSLLTLARERSLTVYDAAYVELAQRTDLPLATLDRAMARAARDIGVPLALEP
ncbi:type II toxin-antitoxin system VapC family toxin [Salinarimonas soli]|uniref:Ribonuclease VapC n=1 Tax=Salinarimonas soli TaxID=1638099 RepID=A0A5B2W157_9HYPH|nr:type II toxin-antitoxin system VapC family toxin [Salinarimonas soli]KAA2244226.1 type II toxin-antitoxin system VapC family toxin [Salinarimonas soli]